jgi:hypothetical protein
MEDSVKKARMNDNMIAMVRGRIEELTRKQLKLVTELREVSDATVALYEQLRELEGR